MYVALSIFDDAEILDKVMCMCTYEKLYKK